MEMEIREVKMEELKPAPYNPRAITDDALDGLSHSIGEFGLVEPIVWNERTGHVVGGHQRLKVLEQTGAKTTKVVVVDLDPEREKALNVALNSRHIQGEWTEGLGAILQELKVELPELSAALRLDVLETDFQKLFPPEGYAGLVDPDVLPEEPEKPVSRPGDLWQLGRHRLICGDSTKPETLKSVIVGDISPWSAGIDVPQAGASGVTSVFTQTLEVPDAQQGGLFDDTSTDWARSLQEGRGCGAWCSSSDGASSA